MVELRSVFEKNPVIAIFSTAISFPGSLQYSFPLLGTSIAVVFNISPRLFGSSENIVMYVKKGISIPLVSAWYNKSLKDKPFTKAWGI